MKKLTDEIVAKELGYKPVHVGNSFNKKTRKHEKSIDWQHPSRPHPDSETWGVQPFTTSLEAIVGEIEARGLDWSIAVDNDHLDVVAKIGNVLRIESHEGFDEAPALALCAALLDYLKEKP